MTPKAQAKKEKQINWTSLKFIMSLLQIQTASGK